MVDCGRGLRCSPIPQRDTASTVFDVSDSQIIRAGERVVLLRSHEALAAGRCGTVLVVFRRATPSYVISFDQGGILEVPGLFVRRVELAA